MNIALKKLAMIEKNYAEMEENARVQGYSDCPSLFSVSITLKICVFPDDGG